MNAVENEKGGDQDYNEVYSNYEEIENQGQSNSSLNSGDPNIIDSGSHYDNFGIFEGVYENSPDEYRNRKDTEYPDNTEYPGPRCQR